MFICALPLSGEGVRQFTAKTVDFGASDTPLNAQKRQAGPGAVQIPEITGSVAVTYNIPGIPTKTLKFTGPVLAGIFQGKITKWSDPQIKALNPGVNLPNANIVVVHRSDGSGTELNITCMTTTITPLSWLSPKRNPNRVVGGICFSHHQPLTYSSSKNVKDDDFSGFRG